MMDPVIPPNRRILVIDDNPAIHADFRKIFQPAHADDAAFVREAAARFRTATPSVSRPAFEVAWAFQGEEGLRKVIAAAEIGRPYAVAFIDMRMPPGWDGMKTTMRLWKMCPDLQVVICTAFLDHSWEEMLEQFGQTDQVLLLKKPFDPIEVLQLAHALTEKWRLRQHAAAVTECLERRVAHRTRELQTANEALRREVAERAAIEEALRQTQKMEAVGHLADRVAHDFNNLLTVIRGYSGILLGNPRLDARSRKALRAVDRAAERATGLTRQLLTPGSRQSIPLE